jgi:hypothetical protein
MGHPLARAVGSHTIGVEAVLDRRVRQPGRLRAGQPVHQPAEQLVGGSELFVGQPGRVRLHQIPPADVSDIRQRNVLIGSFLIR